MKGNPYADAQQCVWLRLEMPVKGRRFTRISRKHSGLPAELLQLHSAFFPEDRHQSQDKISLLERYPLAVDTHEYLGYIFLVDVRRNFQSCKRIVMQVIESVYRTAELVLFSLINIAVSPQSLQEGLDELKAWPAVCP